MQLFLTSNQLNKRRYTHMMDIYVICFWQHKPGGCVKTSWKLKIKCYYRHSADTVSYTHLDVYKRQGHRLILNHQNLLSDAAYYCSLPDDKLQTVIHKKPAAGVVMQYVWAIV